MLTGGRFWSIDSDHSDSELHAPVLHDKGVTVDHTVDFILTSKGDGGNRRKRTRISAGEDDPLRTGHLTTFSL